MDFSNHVRSHSISVTVEGSRTCPYCVRFAARSVSPGPRSAAGGSDDSGLRPSTTGRFPPGASHNFSGSGRAPVSAHRVGYTGHAAGRGHACDAQGPRTIQPTNDDYTEPRRCRREDDHPFDHHRCGTRSSTSAFQQPIFRGRALMRRRRRAAAQAARPRPNRTPVAGSGTGALTPRNVAVPEASNERESYTHVSGPPEHVNGKPAAGTSNRARGDWRCPLTSDPRESRGTTSLPNSSVRRTQVRLRGVAEMGHFDSVVRDGDEREAQLRSRGSPGNSSPP